MNGTNNRHALMVALSSLASLPKMPVVTEEVIVKSMPRHDVDLAIAPIASVSTPRKIHKVSYIKSRRDALSRRNRRLHHGKKN